jgi:flagellar basal-body rod protein FlgB
VDLFDPSIVALEKAMSGAELRQTVLADNIANANTPGFQPSDVDFQSVLAQAVGQGDGASQLEQVTFSPTPVQTGAVQVDGNGVDVNAQMADLSENSLYYQAAESIMGQQMEILKTAIGSTA